MGLTATEKIIGRAAGKPVRAGDLVHPNPDLITVHDWYVANFDTALKDFGIDRVMHPDKVLISTDHEPLAVSPHAAERQRKVREIAARYGIEKFFDVGRGGLGHIFPIEKGIARPGMFVLAYDVHVTNYGAVGCLGVPVVIEISEVLACGSVWLLTPETVRVNLTGSLPRGISVRDVAQKLISDLDPDLVDYTTVEFGGPGLASIDVERRMTLCNTPIEIGAKSALVEVDATARAWLADRGIDASGAVESDADATFKAIVEYDLGLSEPQVAVPPTPDAVVGVSAVAGRKVDHAFVGSCASSSIEDLRDAAHILKGRRISSGVRLFVTPGTVEIARRAASEGLMEIFLESGAIVTAAGCGPCAAGRIGPTAAGEVSINTGTRNDFGRLGSRETEIYLASPYTVAASAVAGRIIDPREML